MIDQLVREFDVALRSVCGPAQTRRPRPGAELAESDLTETERSRAAALLRVDHCGEICAQALYQGQRLMAGDTSIKQAMAQAAEEETEHLHWTEQRLFELGGRKSLLNPLWYAASLAVGLVAGRLGSAWNLGFLAETERQVGAHLESHLCLLPVADARSRAIVAQMKIDEIGHAERATDLGAKSLSSVVQSAMRLSAKLMTTVAYRI